MFKKNYKMTYQNNILNHSEYIQTFHEKDPNRIAEGIKKIIQESLDPLAPIRRIQLSKKNTNRISDEARELLSLRDATYKQYKEMKNQDKYREYKNLKNFTNKKIYRERFENKRNQFHKEGTTSKDKWNMIKRET